MVRAILHGCSGKMGQKVSELCKQDSSIEIVAGIDVNRVPSEDYPVFKTLDTCDVDADVVIDFSNAAAVDELLDFCAEKRLSLVLCTTGLTKEQLKHVKESSEKTAILQSANMSLGINLLMGLVKEAVKTLAYAGFDIEIVEKHHNQKVDAPSGTALALANAMNDEMCGTYEYVYDRSQKQQKRSDKEIGISAVRGGTIVGDHDVIFAGTDEVITFSHQAYSKAVFAKGAIQAAKFMADKLNGLYSMADVIEGD